MIDTPACRLLPGLKELTLVGPLTRLWDKLSRSLPCCKEEATEDEAMTAEPSCAFAKGYGRFGIGYT